MTNENSTINAFEKAELDLRRAQERYQQVLKAKQEEEKAVAPPPPTVKTAPCDLERIQTVQDLVALLRVIGAQINVNLEHPEFDTVRHLVIGRFVEDGQ